MWREVGKAQHPRARLLFQDERETPALLTFPRDTKAGRMDSLATPGKEEEEEEEDWGEGQGDALL